MPSVERGESMEAEEPMPERTIEEQRLDTEIATRLMGYRWVEWGPGAEGPIRKPGRFLARTDSPMAHLHRPADDEAPLHERPLARVPCYSADLAHAFAVAEAASLFRAGKAVLYREEPDGRWTIEVRGLQLTSGQLPELLCRASLEWTPAAEGE